MHPVSFLPNFLQLKRRLYWVIAGVLSAYWAREVLSMLIASPYASPLTLKMVAISSVYHVGKILLISLDAKRQWSPTLGIMRLLMDHWHLSSFKDALLCAKRVSLQVGGGRKVVLDARLFWRRSALTGTTFLRRRPRRMVSMRLLAIDRVGSSEAENATLFSRLAGPG